MGWEGGSCDQARERKEGRGTKKIELIQAQKENGFGDVADGKR